jgi:signal transduction histidine kinase
MVVVVAIVAYGAIATLLTNFTQVRQSRTVHTDLINLLSTLKDAETGERGYIITGDAAYLAPYTGVHGAVKAQLDALQALLVDEPDQQQRLTVLRPLITTRLALLDRTLTLRRTQGFAAAAAAVSTGTGKSLMDQIRAMVQTMEADEGAREATLTAATTGAVRQAILTIAIGGLTTVGLMALANAVVLWELRRRRQAEEALVRQFRAAEAARRETAAILNATNEAIVLVSRERVFLRVNRRFEELFGIPASSVLGKRFGDIQTQFGRIFADADAFRARIANSAADDGLPEFGGAVTQRWPEQRDLEFFSAVAPGPEGSFLGRLYVFRDVTAERAADRLKTEFVSLVSHELRTPLTSIKGYIDLLMAEEAGALNAEQLEFLGIAKSNADRLVTLINDLLDISRIEAGKMELHRQPLALGPLLRQLVSSFRPQLAARQQSLSLDLPPALPVIEGDADRLTQVFGNLLSNATKYTPPGGATRISVSTAADTVQVDVTDTGIGMTPEEVEQLFTKFYRSSHSLVREAGGTGLGLTITRSMVELHGGQILVSSSPGQGSIFSVRLPVADFGHCADVPAAGQR